MRSDVGNAFWTVDSCTMCGKSGSRDPGALANAEASPMIAIVTLADNTASRILEDTGRPASSFAFGRPFY